MKKLLITGKGSYIGASFELYIKDNFPESFEIDTLDMTDADWRSHSFSGYDTVFHVAGIAHSDNSKITPEEEKLYYSVNTTLTAETAEKAKAEGVGQFIFMSSAIVYGDSAPIGKVKLIDENTPPTPANCYGNSKLQAEKIILPMSDENFKVAVLRPPMIYGNGCRGNYPTLSKIAQKFPFFPYVKNQRSMLYIGNLCELVRLIAEDGEGGIFHPQNPEYSNTSSLVALIGKSRGKKVTLIKGFGWALKLLSHFIPTVNKAFGNLAYKKELSQCKYTYQIFSLEESVRLTEGYIETKSKNKRS